MSVSLIIVNYRAASAVERMLETVSGVDEVVAVDHSEEPDEADRLRTLGLDQVIVQPNGGYAAGLNRGVRESRGDVVLLANPDVLFSEGAIQALVEAVSDASVGIAAPQLTWDETGRWSVPQAPHLDWWVELEGRYLPRRSRKRYLGEQLRLWDATEPVQTATVSGTVMAVRREAFRAVGGMDPRYFLFYEENDFCMRVARVGLSAVVVPEARVCHAIGVSAETDAEAHFGPSLDRFRKLWLPRWFTMVWPDAIEPAPAPPRRRDPRRAGPNARWVISPTERYIPLVRGPLVQDLDAEAPDFLPSEAAKGWVRGILDGNRVHRIRNRHR